MMKLKKLVIGIALAFPLAAAPLVISGVSAHAAYNNHPQQFLKMRKNGRLPRMNHFHFAKKLADMNRIGLNRLNRQ